MRQQRMTGMDRLVSALVLALAAVFLSACQQSIFAPKSDQPPRVITDQSAFRAATPRARAISPGTQRLAPGDVIRVFVFDNPDLSQLATIGPDGKFRYPLIGEVTAAGRTLRDLEAVITRGLTRNIVEPQVSVALEDLKSFRVFVNGEVVAPGAFELDGPVSLVQAISLAGGFTAFARRDRIVLYNPSGTPARRVIFNYDAFLTQPGAPDIALRPGDTILVP